MRRGGIFRCMLCLAFLVAMPPSPAVCQESSNGARVGERLTLVHAVMCEEIKDQTPINQTAIFSISRGKAVCFTYFDPVPEKTIVYHNWYKRDKMSSRVKLQLRTPSWSTYSRVTFRRADKGPWRVEVTDEEGTVYKVLRFSITD